MKRLILIFILLLLVSTAYPADSPFNVDCSFGWGGHYRPMEWTPVDIRFDSRLKGNFAGSVEISAQQDEMNTMTIYQRFVLTPELPIQMPMVTKLAFAADKCSVRIIDSNNRTQWHNDFNIFDYSNQQNIIKTAYENDLLIGHAGSLKFNLTQLAAKSSCNSYGMLRNDSQSGEVYFANKNLKLLPYDWTGYASLDVLVLYDMDWSGLDQKHVQSKAICDWVTNGGKLLLVMGANSLPKDSPVTQMLPFEFGPEKDITIPENILRRWNLKGSQPEKVNCRPLTLKENIRLATLDKNENDEGLYGTAPVGYGKVGVLSFSPHFMSPQQTAQTNQFWIRQLQNILPNIETRGNTKVTGRTIVSNEHSHNDNQNDQSMFETGTAQRGNKAVMDHLYNIKQMRPLSIWYVILLLSTLAILLGPVDYLFLKSKGKLPMTWLTSTGWIILFTVGAYYGVQALRGGEMQMRAVSVLDGVSGQEQCWKTTWSGLFAPHSDNFKLEGLETHQWWSAISPSQSHIYHWGNRSGGSQKIFCEQFDGGNRPISMPINIWSMQCMLNESPEKNMPFEATVQRDGKDISLTIKNLSDQPIKRGYVMGENNRAYEFKSVAANSSSELTGKLSVNRKWGVDDNDYNNYSPYDDSPRPMLNKDSSFLAQGCFQRTGAIQSYLAEGAMVVCVEYENMPLPITVKDESCQYSHIQLARLVVFPE